MTEPTFNKAAYLQQKLIKEGLMLGGICIALGLIAAAVAWYSTSTISDRDQLQAENGSLSVSKQTLQTQLDKAKGSQQLYKTIFEHNPKGSTLDREKAKQILDSFRERYRLSKVIINSMPPVTELTDTRFKTKTVSVVSSQVSISLEGLTDEYIFKFISALSREFPGYVRIIKMNVNRQGAITDDVLKAIASKQPPSLVKGELVFYWMGMNYLNTQPAAAPGAAPSAPGATVPATGTP